VHSSPPAIDLRGEARAHPSTEASRLFADPARVPGSDSTDRAAAGTAGRAPTGRTWPVRASAAGCLGRARRAG